MMNNNNAVLYQGLFVFRNAMLPFIVSQLKSAFGKGWWEAGVKRALGEDTIASLEKQFGKRYRTELASVNRPGHETYQMLDVAHFLPIFQRNWSRFSSTFGDQNRSKVEVWLGEIIEVRNAIAHPEDQPLADEDTWRALDTMVRFIQPVSLDACEEIKKIRRDAASESFPQSEAQAKSDTEPGGESLASTQGEGASATDPLWRDLRIGPYDYGKGLRHLEPVILEKEGEESEIHFKLIAHKRQLHTSLWEKKLRPGIEDGQLENRIERILEELDKLSYHYLQRPFSELSIDESPPTETRGTGAAFDQIRILEREIKDLKVDLYVWESRRAVGRQTGETVTKLETQISQTRSQLSSKQDQLARLINEAAPPAYFSVRRTVAAGRRSAWIEEQAVTVAVELTNKGGHKTKLQYEEVLPASFKVVGGVMSYQGWLGAGQTIKITYQCYAGEPGTFQIDSHIQYARRNEQWDQADVTTVEVIPGSGPQIVASRYYRLEAGGMKMLLRLENLGDKIARSVRFEEQIGVLGETSSFQFSWLGDIVGGYEKLIEHPLPVLDPDQVTLQADSELTFEDSHGERFSLILPNQMKRIEYDFPGTTDTRVATVGRDAEIAVLASMVDNIWQLGRGRIDPDAKRLVLIHGIEGTGKTRLVLELTERARQKGIASFVEDAKDRSPVKRMLRRLLGLQPDENNDAIIWQALEERMPGEEYSLRREIIFRIVSTTPSRFSEEELDLLEAHVNATLKTLCLESPSVLVFENVHLTPEGYEDRLLSALVQNVLLNRNDPLLLCVTYRPGEPTTPPILDRLKIPHTHQEVLHLGTLRPDAIRKLVDNVIYFPRFSEPLHRFVAQWSGNPLYLIELLRLLAHPDSPYITRVGSEWYPTSSVALEGVVPRSIDAVILERANIELKAEADLLKTLAVIGFELPPKLVEALVNAEFPAMSADALSQHLTMLERSGFLVYNRALEGYEFEHQLKRDVLMSSLDERKQLLLRKQIAQILLNNEHVFLDPEEQLRQLARHIVKAPREFQIEHATVIRRAANLENGTRNFTRSLQFLNSVLDLVPQDSWDRAELLLERSRLHQLRGTWASAQRDLDQLADLVLPDTALSKKDSKRAHRLRYLVQKEQARVLLRQPMASLEEARRLLDAARKEMEGNLGIHRHILPNDLEFHRNLMETYLALAEVAMRSNNLKECERACRRAEDIAQHALKLWPSGSLLPQVYQTLGELHEERGKYEDALKYYSYALKSAEGDRYEMERIWLHMADVFHAIGDTNRALDTYQQAIRLQEELGDVHGLALSYGGLGDIMIEQQQFEQGRYYCEQALAYQQLVSDLDRFWRTCISLVKVHMHVDDLDKASEYWFRARPILFQQHRFDSKNVSTRKRSELYDLATRLADHFRQRSDWGRAIPCLQDMDNMSLLHHGNKEGAAIIQLQLGEASYQNRQWQEAEAAFTEALNLASEWSTKAMAHEWLGDLGASQKPVELPTEVELGSPGKIRDEATLSYEQAIIHWSRAGKIDRVLSNYEKLLARMVNDQLLLSQFPFIYLRLLQTIPYPQVREQVTKKAIELLLKHELPAEAGDIAVYAAREIVKTDDRVISLERKLEYLKRAEAVYRKGNPEDVIWGLNMLIPSFARIGDWDQVARCFEELFELSVQTGDAEEFIMTLGALGELREHFAVEDIEHFTNMALSGQRQMVLEPVMHF